RDHDVGESPHDRPLRRREELRRVGLARGCLGRLLAHLLLRREQPPGRKHDSRDGDLRDADQQLAPVDPGRPFRLLLLAHRFPLLRSSAMCSAVRIARARIVQVQFLWAFVTNGPASATNTFFASCAWHHSFSTDVRGLSPMRVVPTSWMISPPTEMPSSVGISVRARRLRLRSITLPPIASMTLAKVLRMCRTWPSSESPHCQWKRSAGIPQRSTISGSRSQ